MSSGENPRVALLMTGTPTPDAAPVRLARALASNGWTVLLVAPAYGADFSVERIRGVRVARAPIWPPFVLAARQARRQAGPTGRASYAAARVSRFSARMARDFADRLRQPTPEAQPSPGSVPYPWPGDVARAYLPVLEAFQPDLVHALDGATLYAALRATRAPGSRRGSRGRALVGYGLGEWTGSGREPGAGEPRRADISCLSATEPAEVADAYARVLGWMPGRLGRSVTTGARPTPGGSGPVLGIGPTNLAGQGGAWAHAVAHHLGAEAEAWQLERDDGLLFPAARRIASAEWLSPVWQLGEFSRLTDGYTHLLSEGLVSLFGSLNTGWASDDLQELYHAGIRVGVVFHGSDIRDPRRHRALEKYSPFAAADHPLTQAMERRAREAADALNEFDGPRYVTTPDLLDDVPDALWLPVVVDLPAGAAVSEAGRPPLERERPVVVHVASNPFLTGTDLIEPVVRELHERGLIEYRRLESVSPDRLPAVLREADVVLDHFLLGSYGVLSCQAMAAGRITVCHVGARTRERIGTPLPILQATPDTLGEVLERVVADRRWALEAAAAGPDFVREFHDGRMSARILADFLQIGDRRGGGRRPGDSQHRGPVGGDPDQDGQEAQQ